MPLPLTVLALLLHGQPRVPSWFYVQVESPAQGFSDFAERRDARLVFPGLEPGHSGVWQAEFARQSSLRQVSPLPVPAQLRAQRGTPSLIRRFHDFRI